MLRQTHTKAYFCSFSADYLYCPFPPFQQKGRKETVKAVVTQTPREYYNKDIDSSSSQFCHPQRHTERLGDKNVMFQTNHFIHQGTAKWIESITCSNNFLTYVNVNLPLGTIWVTRTTFTILIRILEYEAVCPLYTIRTFFNTIGAIFKMKAFGTMIWSLRRKKKHRISTFLFQFGDPQELLRDIK